MIDKKVVQLHFDRGAKYYDEYAVVQKKMANTLMHLLTNVKCAENMMDIGCGTGVLTEKLITQFPDANITCVDISQSMLDQVMQKFSKANITPVCADAETHPLDSMYDLMISNATFQWFNHLENTLKNLLIHLNEGGVLSFATFGQNTFCELHAAYQEAADHLGVIHFEPPGQTFYYANELAAMLNRVKLRDDVFHVEEETELVYYPSVKEFLTSIKKIGANNSNQRRNLQLPLVREMMQVYENKYREPQGIPVTYQLLYLKLERNNG